MFDHMNTVGPLPVSRHVNVPLQLVLTTVVKPEIVDVPSTCVRRSLMSLTVSPDLLAQAEAGHVDQEAFLACVRDSLPYAYSLVERLAGELPTAERDFADNLVPPADNVAQGQLLRAMASTSIRGAGTAFRGGVGVPELPSAGRVPPAGGRRRAAPPVYLRGEPGPQPAAGVCRLLTDRQGAWLCRVTGSAGRRFDRDVAAAGGGFSAGSGSRWGALWSSRMWAVVILVLLAIRSGPVARRGRGPVARASCPRRERARRR